MIEKSKDRGAIPNKPYQDDGVIRKRSHLHELLSELDRTPENTTTGKDVKRDHSTSEIKKRKKEKRRRRQENVEVDFGNGPPSHIVECIDIRALAKSKSSSERVLQNESLDHIRGRDKTNGLSNTNYSTNARGTTRSHHTKRPSLKTDRSESDTNQVVNKKSQRKLSDKRPHSSSSSQKEKYGSATRKQRHSDNQNSERPVDMVITSGNTSQKQGRRSQESERITMKPSDSTSKNKSRPSQVTQKKLQRNDENTIRKSNESDMLPSSPSPKHCKLQNQNMDGNAMVTIQSKDNISAQSSSTSKKMKRQKGISDGINQNKSKKSIKKTSSTKKQTKSSETSRAEKDANVHNKKDQFSLTKAPSKRKKGRDEQKKSKAAERISDENVVPAKSAPAETLHGKGSHFLPVEKNPKYSHSTSSNSSTSLSSRDHSWTPMRCLSNLQLAKRLSASEKTTDESAQLDGSSSSLRPKRVSSTTSSVLGLCGGMNIETEIPEPKPRETLMLQKPEKWFKRSNNTTMSLEEDRKARTMEMVFFEQ